MLCFSQSSRLPAGPVQAAVEAAIAAGYRHIDTARTYRNEVDIGKALQSKIGQGVIRRQDMFIVSKVGSVDDTEGSDNETTKPSVTPTSC